MLKRGLIVSCQAVEGEPLHGYNVMRLMAKAAVEGGACGIRALDYDVDAIKGEVDVPVIALVKQCYKGSAVYITPTKKEIDSLRKTKAECWAMDATLRERPNGETLEELVRYAREVAPRVELMADVSTVEEAVRAKALGFDYISTTLRGYTENTKDAKLPDVQFVADVIQAVGEAKVVAEGGIYEVGELERISALNPYAVVIGSAITRPMVTTQRFNKVLRLK